MWWILKKEGRAQQKTVAHSLIGKILPEDTVAALPESFGIHKLGKNGSVKTKWIILTVIACFLLLFIGTLKFAMLI